MKQPDNIVLFFPDAEFIFTRGKEPRAADWDLHAL